jgi:hypothetical protein|tara:strand:- start:1133 stop:1483 length:351 start_codon:yes stop_codon:yes gene_type:complete
MPYSLNLNHIEEHQFNRSMSESWDDYCVRQLREQRERTDKMKDNALTKQVDGTHYKECQIQPVEYIVGNKLDFLEGNIVKYITRHRTKGEGSADIKKVIHYAELILELVYGEEKLK